MLEGTTTEIAAGKLLTQDASIGDEYTSTAPKVGTILQKMVSLIFTKDIVLHQRQKRVQLMKMKKRLFMTF